MNNSTKRGVPRRRALLGVLGVASLWSARSAPTGQAGARDITSLRDFGAVGDGVADDSEALQAAINASYKNFNRTILIPNGIYRLTRTIVIGQGVMLRGEGSQGSNERYGTVFKHYSNDSCFRFDASGAAFAGTGGGLENCLILKAGGFNGGSAVEIVALSDRQRPGEMMLTNVLAYGSDGTGRWAHGLHVDGTACNVRGARGVRSINCRKVRFADVDIPGETVLLNQATHFYAHGLAIDSSHGAPGGLMLRGINDGIYLNALGCAGKFEVVANDAVNATRNLHVDGKVGGSFVNNDAEVDGVVVLSGIGGLANHSRKLKVVADRTPEVSATRSTIGRNVTGDGTTYRAAFDAKSSDPLGSFNGNSFTCTVAGRHEFNIGIGLQGVDAVHDRCEIALLRAGSLQRAVMDVCNPASQASAGLFTRTMTCMLDLAFGDTVQVTVKVSGSRKSIDILGSGEVDLSWFSAKYVS